MHVLVGNIVKTEVADYPCATREEAEALYLALRNRDAERARRSQAEKPAERAAESRKPR